MPRTRSPATRFLTVLLGVAVTVTALLLGVMALAIILGLGMIAAVVLAIRVWWLRRRAAPISRARGGRDGGYLIEGEFRRHHGTGRRTPP